jgi:hypothetical protein
MAEATLFVHDLEAAVSPGGSGPLRGRDLGDLPVQSPASVAISGERVLAVGPPEEVLREHPPGPNCVTVDGRGAVALPGLVDCHAHPAFLGDRAAEFELRSAGASYEEIHTSGGGILSTVEATRAGAKRNWRPPSGGTWAGCWSTAPSPPRRSPATASTGRPRSRAFGPSPGPRRGAPRRLPHLSRRPHGAAGVRLGGGVRRVRR